MSSASALDLFLLGMLAVALMGSGAWMFLKSRQTAAERERRRRLTVNRTGRMGDATITDVREYVLFYSYELRGVAYTTSQDAADFKNLLPAETAVLIGPVGIKYTPGNPANSIVICEQWSGLRPVAQQTIPETQENMHP
jgi:hypothetical protein